MNSLLSSTGVLRQRTKRPDRVGVSGVELLDDEQELVGSLNIYSYTASAFDPFDEALMGLFSVAAGQAITNARRWQHSRETVTQLERALISRPEIEMAKGALIAQHGCNPDEAFARLVDQSQRRNVRLHVIAQELLTSLQ